MSRSSSICILFVLSLIIATCSGEKVPALARTSRLPTLAQVVTSGDRFTVLVQLLKAAGLLETAINAKDVTILAPTDDAFLQTARDIGCRTARDKASAVRCTVLLPRVKKWKEIVDSVEVASAKK